MDVATASNQKPALKPLALLGRDEMNLAEFPITLLTDRVPKDQKEAIYQDEIYDERSGLTLSRKLTISAGNHGLTTAVDDEIILGLIQLTKNANDFTKKKVDFSRHELIRLLGWPRTGASYDRILLSLKRWTSVFLQYENAWRDNRTKTWKSVGFHIIDKYEITDSRTTDEQLDLLPSHIVWGEDIFESFQAGYLKPLDYDLCMGLTYSTAKRMYRFLDKRFHHKPDWIFDLKEFAHAHAGLSQCYEGPAHLKRNLLPAIVELEKVGILEPLPESERFIKDGKNWKIRLVSQAKSAPLATLPDNEQTIEGEPPRLVTQLTDRGVTRATAAELVQRHAAELIEAKIDVFDWLVEKQDKRVAKSPAGYLVKSIDDDYATPKGFTSKTERQKREEAHQAREHEINEKRRRERKEEARLKAERQAVDAYLKELDPDKRSALEAEVLAQADEKTRQSYEDPTMARFRGTFMLGMLREYLPPMLNLRKPVPVDA
jgi:Replication initiator protein A